MRKQIRLWSVATTGLLLVTIMLLGYHQTRPVCADAPFQTLQVFQNDEVPASQRFQPPALLRSSESPTVQPLWYPDELLPSSFDWRTYGSLGPDAGVDDPKFTDPNVTPPKNQAACGSCYAFGTLGSVEAFLARSGLGSLDLSENNVKNCNVRSAENTAEGGCGGGTFLAVVNWLNKQGTVLESEDPYTPQKAACNSGVAFRHTILGWLAVGTNGEYPKPTDLKNYLINYGPLEISVKADNPGATGQKFKEYAGVKPIYMPLTKADNVDHSVLLVGWDDNVTHEGGKGVWIIKNSWGTDWGKQGFAEIAYGSANLGLGTSYVPNQYQPYDPNGELLYYDKYGRGKQYYTSGMGNHGMVKFTPPKDSCADRVELQLFDKATDIDITIYDDLNNTTNSWNETVQVPANPLIKLLDKSSVDGGNVSFKLPNPVRLTKDNDVFVAISMQPGNLAADGSTTLPSGRAYFSSDGKEWATTQYAYNIRLRTTTCGSNVPTDPTPTTTPFVPTATPTTQPTPSPTATLAPNQPTPAPTATQPAATTCTVPASMFQRASAASPAQPSQAQSAAPLPLKAQPLAPERFSSPRTTQVASGGVASNHLRWQGGGTDQFFTGLNETPAEPNVTGGILLPDETAAAYAYIYAYPTDGQGNPYSEPLFSGLTDEEGNFAFTLGDGNYLLIVDPPAEYLDGSPLDGAQTLTHRFTVSTQSGPGGTIPPTDGPTDLGTLTLPATTKVIRGRVADANNGPIMEAEIQAYNAASGQWLYTFPANDGSFELHVGGGVWEVSLLAYPNVTWAAIDPIQQVEFEMDTSSETYADANFAVHSADALIVGRVVASDGSAPAVDTLDEFGLNPDASFDVFGLESDRFVYGYIDASGAFTIPVLAGRYAGSVWLAADSYPQYTGPFYPEVISVVSGTVDVGQIVLLANNATVKGSVLDSDGLPVQGVFVDIWQDNGLWLYGATDVNGAYEIVAPAGAWSVEPYPMEYQAKIFTGNPKPVTLTANETTTIDFSLEPSAGLLFGEVVDDQNKLLTALDAYVYIRRGDESSPVSLAPVTNGRFTLKMPYGDLHVGLYLGPDSPYSLPGEVTPAAAQAMHDLAFLSVSALVNREQVAFTQLAQGDRAVTLQLTPTNAKITGQLVDAANEPVTGIFGYVSATAQGQPNQWKWSKIDPDDGSFSLDVMAGNWELVYVLQNADPSVAATAERSTLVTAVANEPTTQNLQLTTLNNVVSGTVVDENNRPVPNTKVWLRGNGYETYGRSDATGAFEIRVPDSAVGSAAEGAMQASFTIGTGVSSAATCTPTSCPAGPSSTTLDAVPQQIQIATDVQQRVGNSNATLVVRQANTYLTGQILNSWNNNQPVKGAQVTGKNSKDGQTFSTTTDANGCYAAPVKANGAYEWVITGKFEDTDGFTAITTLTLTGSAAPATAAGQAAKATVATIPVDAAMVLQYAGTMPAPLVHTFSNKNGWSHTMPDGFTISIPPNAIKTRDSQVRIEVAPTMEISDSFLHRVAGYGYQISFTDSKGRALQAKFSQDVFLTFRYTEGLVSEEGALVVGRQVENSWQLQKQALQDSTANSFALSVNEPGTFALLVPTVIGTSSPEPLSNQVFLPVIQK
ncbi:MAG: C1 family peptidase [Caldilineaceae bacterium]